MMRLVLGACAPLLLPLVLSGCAGSNPEAGEGSGGGCTGPYLNAESPPGFSYPGPTVTVEPGDTVDLYGHGYTSTCNDTGGSDEVEPLPQVSVTVAMPGGEVLDLGQFSPSAQGDDVGFAATFTVPVGTPPGLATASDDRPNAATYAFRVDD